MAGTRAMNGEASSATMAMSWMAARHPGSPAAARAPATSRAARSRLPGDGTGLGNRTSTRATTTAANEAALMPKTRP